MLKKVIYSCVFFTMFAIVADCDSDASVKRGSVRADKLLVTHNATVLGKKLIKGSLAAGDLIFECPPRHVISSESGDLVEGGSVVGLSAMLKLPDTIEDVEVNGIGQIPLYFENPHSCIVRGSGIAATQFTIPQRAQVIEAGDTLQLVLVELTVTLSLDEALASPPIVLLTFEDRSAKSDLFQECILNPLVNGCIFWANNQFITRVHRSSVKIHQLLYFYLNTGDGDFIPASFVTALNEQVRDIINKTAIDVRVSGAVALSCESC